MREYCISSSFLGVVLTARVAFSERSWPFVPALVLPWLLCAGQRCLTRMAALGSLRRHLSSYYRFLSDGKFRMEAFFRSLFELIVQTFPAGILALVLDDTLVPKWGRGIFGTGSFFDHVRRPRPGFIWGHNWVVLAVVVQLGPVAWVALPFWVRLYRSKKTCPKKDFRTRHQLALEAIEAVRLWYAGPILLLADGAYNNRSLVRPLRRMGIHLVSRLRCDARLRSTKIPRRPKGKRGRKPKWGPPLPSLGKMARQRRAFQKEEVAIYGKIVTLLLREVLAYWPPLGCVVKVVITRDPKRPRRVAYLMTTDVTLSAVQVVEWFAKRWTVEQLFSIAKTQLGFDSAEVRTERAVTRHAALTMALATWVEVWWRRAHPRARVRTFASKLGALREEAVREMVFASGPRTRRSRRNAEGIASLFRVATAAA